MLVLENIQLGYRRSGAATAVFVPFSARAGAGRLTALLGRNGCGKSTLLRCIVGLQRVLSGGIYIDGSSVCHTPPRKMAALVSYVSTDNVKGGFLKTFDLVALGRYPYLGLLGGLGGGGRAIVERSLEQVGMLWAVRKNISQLSDGERQRVIIARALSQDTPVIVLDEPTVFLDVPNRCEIVALLKTLAEQHGKTIIFSTHDLALTLETAHQIWLMGRGRFCAAPPQVLERQGILQEEFALPHSQCRV